MRVDLFAGRKNSVLRKTGEGARLSICTYASAVVR